MTHIDFIYPGFFIDAFQRWSRIAKEREIDTSSPDDSKITVEGHQANGTYGIHQSTLRLEGDPTIYRMIVAPADAPICVNGQPIDNHFLETLA